MYYAYTKEGKQISFHHPIDQYTAIQSGKFLARPPGTPEPEAPPEPPEGEQVEGVDETPPEVKTEGKKAKRS